MDDLISRQAAVDMLMERASNLRGTVGDLGGACSGAAKLIAQFPSAQAEIIRCKDCKYWNPFSRECEGIGNWFGLIDAWSENGFCYKGERVE